MVFVLPNGKELKRSKGIKNKLSPAKVATIHKKLLSILFDINETTVSRQFVSLKLSLRNPYAVREYIEWKMEYNGGELGSRWKTAHGEYNKKIHQRRTTRKKRSPRQPSIDESVELGDKFENGDGI